MLILELCSSWPDSVRAYVQRAFAVENSIPDVSRQEMEIRLKQVIAQAVQEGSLYSTQWQNAPLPQQLIVKEREDATAAFANPPWGNGVTPLTLQETNNKAHDSMSKKRKSSEMDNPQLFQEKIPPWHSPNPHNVF